MKMKILALSDTPDKMLWDYLDRRLLEGVELVLSCGDLPAEYLSFLTCFTDAPILYVCGNHDTGYEKKPPEGCICIDDTLYIHNGVRILGLGGSMRYKAGSCMYTEREMRHRVHRLAPKLMWHRGFDILVAHAPVRGIGDQEDLPHQGFEVFRDLADKYAPRYIIHGHVHQEYSPEFHREREYGDTKIINAYKRFFIDL